MTGKSTLKLLVSGNPRNDLARKTGRKAIELLKEQSIKTSIHSGFIKGKNSLPLEKVDPDIALIFGGDGALLHFIRGLKEKEIPVLGVNCGAKGKLMQIPHKRIDFALRNLSQKKIKKEKRTRLDSVADKKVLPTALNDVMLAPEKPAVLMRYDLFIDGEYQFRDIADGVLISTVTGAEAYSVGLGNIIAHKDAKIFIIRPLNSLWHPNPIIVHESSKVVIDNIDCPMPVEAIVDGQERIRVKEKVSLNKSKIDAVFAFLDVELVEEKDHMKDAMPSAKYIYWMLKEKGSLTQQEIIEETGLNWRTVKRALDFLTSHEIVSKQPLFSNRKQKLYSIR